VAVAAVVALALAAMVVATALLLSRDEAPADMPVATDPSLSGATPLTPPSTEPLAPDDDSRLAPDAPVTATIDLAPPAGVAAGALGAAQLIGPPERSALRLVAEGLAPADQQRVYAVWLVSASGERRLVGYPTQQPSADQPILAAQDALSLEPGQFDALLITSEDRDIDASPTQPGEILLRGELERE
jgi:hypothetical protein